MPAIDLVSPQLPLLRRYARALTGSQASADAYVAAMLETLVADPNVFDLQAAPRETLYKLFSRTWNSMAINAQKMANNDSDGGLAHDWRIEAITPLACQAFLLTAGEGFSNAEAARVLQISVGEISCLIDEAVKEIGSQLASTVIIIEDDPIIALDLEAIVTSIGHVVVGTARTHEEAVQMVRAQRPGLVLVDIRLADGSSGLEAANEIVESVDVPIVFITACPETMLTGQCSEPTFLISKPYRPETIKAIISQALFLTLLDGYARPNQEDICPPATLTNH